MEPNSAIVNYLFESGELKRIKRSGWWLAKIKDPESVAEHSFRTAIVAFFLAKMEGADPQKVCSAAVFHDVCEARMLDLHKVAARYVDTGEEVEQRVVLDQIKELPASLSVELENTLIHLSEKERIILKDADLLECALQAKEYVEVGYADCEDWITNIEKRLKTDSAKRLLAEAKTMRSGEWWKGLKKLD